MNSNAKVVAEPVARHEHGFDVKLQLLKLVVQFCAVETKRGLYDIAEAALKHLGQRATAVERVVSNRVHVKHGEQHSEKQRRAPFWPSG